MKIFIREIEIQASAQTIWKVMMDVESWNLWTTTVTRIKMLNASKMAVGTKLQIEQLNLSKATWKVDSLDPEQEFTIAKRQPFLSVVGGHEIARTTTGHRVTLSLKFSGLFANWVAKKYGSMMESYLDTEAMGLKRACEKLDEYKRKDTEIRTATV